MAPKKRKGSQYVAQNLLICRAFTLQEARKHSQYVAEDLLICRWKGVQQEKKRPLQDAKRLLICRAWVWCQVLDICEGQEKPTNLSTMTWLFRLLNMILITETFYLPAINEEFWQLKIAEWWNLLICRWMEKRMGWIIRNYLYIFFVVLSSGATVVLLPCKSYPFTLQKLSFCNTSVVQLQAKGVHL